MLYIIGVLFLLALLFIPLWYFVIRKKPDDTGSDDTGPDDKGSDDKGSGGSTGGPSIDECTAKFNIDNSSGCQNSSEAGIKWAWNRAAADGIGQRCLTKTAGYNVTVESSWSPGEKLMSYVDKGETSTIGIRNVPGNFVSDSTVTFTVDPVDINKRSVIAAPSTVTLDRTNVSADCSAQGIESQIKDLTFWNGNKTYWPVRVKNNPGSSTNLHVEVYDSNGRRLNDDVYPIPDNNMYYVPKGGKIVMSCYIAAGQSDEWTYDKLKSKNISQLVYHCSLGWFKTNINLDSAS
jgi:hypothetical protein